MRIMSKNLNGKMASIILEAAISFPLFLVLILAMVSSMTVVNADLYLQRATENVVSELNLSIPFISNGILCADDITSAFGFGEETQLNTEEIDEALGVVGVISGVTGVDLEDVLSTSVLGRYIRDRILLEYRKISDTGWVYDQLLQNVSVYLDYENKERSIYVYVYYDIVSGELSLPRSYCSSLALYAESLPLGKPGEKKDESTDSVWDQENFERGIALRNEFGGNLPANYPVIGRFEEGEATSIKSIDTTAPYYMVKANLNKKLKGYINDLSDFEGQNYGGISIEAGEIKKKSLIIVIPENGTADCREWIADMISYAKERGVDLNIEEFGESHRYISDNV